MLFAVCSLLYHKTYDIIWRLTKQGVELYSPCFFILYSYLFSSDLSALGFDIRVYKTPSETPGWKLQMYICMHMYVCVQKWFHKKRCLGEEENKNVKRTGAMTKISDVFCGLLQTCFHVSVVYLSSEFTNVYFIKSVFGSSTM